MASSQGFTLTSADKVAIAVHTGGLPRFVRVIPGVGGASLTRALAGSTGEDESSAEQRKLSLGLSPADPDSRTLREAARRLAQEVRDTLQFHAGADPEHPARRVVVTGLGAASDGFTDVVAETLGLPVSVLAPPPVGRTAKPEHAQLAVSFGLCLGAAA